MALKVLTALLIAAAPALATELESEQCLTERFRPQYHFSPVRNWINDPNGLVYLDGEFHLFYQYSPESSVPKDISWGHAVSTDLVQWVELGVAIPATSDEQIFSGSAVIDVNNTAGFGAGAMVAVYTSAYNSSGIQAQSLAYSTDKGRTFTKYSGNPVLDLGLTQFRDPNVQWYEPGKFWLMAVSLADEHKISFYSSPDLKNWTHLSDFGPAGAGTTLPAQYECPDLYELPLSGDSEQKSKWVLVVNINPGGLYGGSSAQYFIGSFDGSTFTSDDDASRVRWLDYGKDYYAAISWQNVPDGRRYMIGWMSNWLYAKETPTSPWRNAMSVPREMSLRRVGDDVILIQEPVAALSSLKRKSSRECPPKKEYLNATNPGDRVVKALSKQRGTAYHLTLTLDTPTATRRQGVRVRSGEGEYTEIAYEWMSGKLFVDRNMSGNTSFSTDFPGVHSAPVRLRDGKLKLDVFVDWSSVEVFVNGGEQVITDCIFPDDASDGIELFVDGGSAEFSDVKQSALESYRVECANATSSWLSKIVSLIHPARCD